MFSHLNTTLSFVHHLYNCLNTCRHVLQLQCWLAEYNVSKELFSTATIKKDFFPLAVLNRALIFWLKSFLMKKQSYGCIPECTLPFHISELAVQQPAGSHEPYISFKKPFRGNVALWQALIPAEEEMMDVSYVWVFLSCVFVRWQSKSGTIQSLLCIPD